MRAVNKAGLRDLEAKAGPLTRSRWRTDAMRISLLPVLRLMQMAKARKEEDWGMQQLWVTEWRAPALLRYTQPWDTTLGPLGVHRALEEG